MAIRWIDCISVLVVALEQTKISSIAAKANTHTHTRSCERETRTAKKTKTKTNRWKRNEMNKEIWNEKWSCVSSLFTAAPLPPSRPVSLSVVHVCMYLCIQRQCQCWSCWHWNNIVHHFDVHDIRLYKRQVVQHGKRNPQNYEPNTVEHLLWHIKTHYSFLSFPFSLFSFHPFNQGLSLILIKGYEVTDTQIVTIQINVLKMNEKLRTTLSPQIEYCNVRSNGNVCFSNRFMLIIIIWIAYYRKFAFQAANEKQMYSK